MDNQFWMYVVIGFLGFIILIQYFTVRNLEEEKAWLKNKILRMMPGNAITADSRLSQDWQQRNLVRRVR